MLSRAQTFSVITAVAVAAGLAMFLAAGVPGRASAAPRATQEAKRIHGLRHSIVLHRARTWRLQDQMHVPRAPTQHMERRTRSVPFLRWMNGKWWHRQQVAYRRLKSISGSSPADARRIICIVFGHVQCRKARDTAYRESRDLITAWNSSDHGGLFQLGTGERATYATIGYSTAYEQVVAAHNLWRARGWEPWDCCVVG